MEMRLGPAAGRAPSSSALPVARRCSFVGPKAVRQRLGQRSGRGGRGSEPRPRGGAVPQVSLLSSAATIHTGVEIYQQERRRLTRRQSTETKPKAWFLCQ